MMGARTGRNTASLTLVAVICAFGAIFAAAFPARAADDVRSKPKVRAVTAFVRLDCAHYQEQIQETLKFLRQAKAAFEKSGYEVMTIRITTQPFPEYTRAMTDEQVLAFFRDYDALAVKEGFDAAIGPAMMSDTDDPHQAELLAKIIANSKTLEGSVFIAGEDGIHWRAIHAAAGVIKYLEANTPHSQGNFSFTAASLIPSGTPFYPASYFTGEGKQFAIGLESANVVTEVFASTNSPALAEERLRSVLSVYATEIEKTAVGISDISGWKYGGLDLSPAPLMDVSIGRAIENFLSAPVGSGGTMTGDTVLAHRWNEGHLSMDALLAYSAVCGTGLDTIPMPGDVTPEQLERILGDVASLSVKWHKPLSARLQPVTGKKPGDMTEFDDPFLVNAKIQPLP